ncbi:hypothetical protein EXIGLDRAFT_726559 [Exidia glandulosa HHB12029]|uniref:Peptidase C14 caspase domain-containing protein n=1 Tax=Exidia glandulosa HHB12029 TaxID=1314781 RepID=A0A165DP25_EXIGL|nr:hypothetical protein EXIGLDRAFT_726559 [Exidia glandulosa HHB12029]
MPDVTILGLPHLQAPHPQAASVVRRPKTFALLIGIEYAPRRGHVNTTFTRLKLPHDDITAFRSMLIDVFHLNEDDITVMVDDTSCSPFLRPTRRNIIVQLLRLVDDAQPGDKLVLAYSGHAKQIPTMDPREEDGEDEYIVPYDWAFWGCISDDLLNKILVQNLPPGVTLFTIFDACSCGTILDLPHNWKLNHNKTVVGPATFPSPSAVGRIVDIIRQASESWSPPSEVLCFSAASDGLTAWEKLSRKSGPYSFLRLFIATIRNNPGISVQDAFEDIAKGLKWCQTPQFSSNNLCLSIGKPLSSFLKASEG